MARVRKWTISSEPCCSLFSFPSFCFIFPVVFFFTAQVVKKYSGSN
jgi:hypothetical protein